MGRVMLRHDFHSASCRYDKKHLNIYRLSKYFRMLYKVILQQFSTQALLIVDELVKILF